MLFWDVPRSFADLPGYIFIVILCEKKKLSFAENGNTIKTMNSQEVMPVDILSLISPMDSDCIRLIENEYNILSTNSNKLHMITSEYIRSLIVNAVCNVPENAPVYGYFDTELP